MCSRDHYAAGLEPRFSTVSMAVFCIFSKAEDPYDLKDRLEEIVPSVLRLLVTK